jgi:hypothetical protein
VLLHRGHGAIKGDGGPNRCHSRGLRKNEVLRSS